VFENLSLEAKFIFVVFSNFKNYETMDGMDDMYDMDDTWMVDLNYPYMFESTSTRIDREWS
jgi:hypothetical protein